MFCRTCWDPVLPSSEPLSLPPESWVEGQLAAFGSERCWQDQHPSALVAHILRSGKHALSVTTAAGHLISEDRLDLMLLSPAWLLTHGRQGQSSIDEAGINLRIQMGRRIESS